MSRADRLADRLETEGLDLLLVTDLVNLRYLTGFTGTNGMAVAGRSLRRFVTDFRYRERAEAEVSDFDREEGPRDFVEALANGWPTGELRVGFEDHKVSVRQHARLREVVPDEIDLVPAGPLVERLRAVKEPGELAAIRAAAALADEALTAVLGKGLAGRTEQAVALDLETEIRRRGAQAIAFPPIVASGAHGALPHATPRDAEIPRDTLVTIDWGARLDGYCSDCTRTYATGEVTGAMADVYSLVERAQAEALAAVRAGVRARDADAVARELIAAAGHGEHFGHGLGHGLGLEVHEDPRLTRTGEDILAEGHVVTVEPGVYLPGVGGVRIEDLAFVTASEPEVASSLGKQLIRVG